MKQTQRTGFAVCLLSLLLGCVVFASIPQAQAETMTETRYLLNFYQWKYGVTGTYPFFIGNETDYGGTYAEKTSIAANTYCRYGIRVWRNYYDPTIQDLSPLYEELTSGSPSVLFQRSGNGEGYQSGTWNCPAWNITRKDTLNVRIYTAFGAIAAWYLLLEVATGDVTDFGTEPLGYDSILNVDWNFTLYTYRNKPAGTTYSRIYWGNSTYNSRIENMQFDNGITTTIEENMEQYFLLGGSMTFLIGFGIVLTRRKRLEP